MPPEQIVVAGASAGGVEALLQLVRGLPADLPAPVCIVVHQPPRAQTGLPRILARAGRLPAVEAHDRDLLLAGRIFVAPPNAHLIIQDAHLRLLRTARENGHRPAIDPLFRSAARARGRHAIGVLLSGADDDGSEGLLSIKAAGGMALVQDPDEAYFPHMPRSAIEHVAVDAIVGAAELGPAIDRALTRLRETGADSTVETEKKPEMERQELEQRIAAWGDGVPEDSASGFSCPLCGGGIWIGNEGPLPRFHCHTGHEFSGDAFLEEQAMVLETTLWQGVRALAEREGLLRRLARQRTTADVGRLVEQADELEAGVRLLRQLLQGSGTTAAGEQQPA